MSFDSDELLKARLKDICNETNNKNIPSFLGFLNEAEFSICKTILDSNHIKYTFWGGYEQAVKKYVCVLPDWADTADFPFCCVRFDFNSNYSLSHRDFLGKLMSMGLSREKIGDIIVNEGNAFVFLANSIASFCVDNISKVGSVGVSVSLCDEPEIRQKEFLSIRKVVSSKRADCVVSAVCNLSRQKAKEFILSGKMIINYKVCQNISQPVADSDVLSLRGYGKFVVKSTSGTTKKDRIVLELDKYI